MAQIYDVLKQEHKQVSQMLEKMTQRKPTQKQIDDLYVMLEAHTKAEEKTLYQDLMKVKQTKDVVMEGFEEHHVADVLLKEIRRLDPGDDRVKAKLMVLKENVEHHVQEEEEKMFPQAQHAKDGMWAEEMAQKFEKQEQTLRKRLH